MRLLELAPSFPSLISDLQRNDSGSQKQWAWAGRRPWIENWIESDLVNSIAHMAVLMQYNVLWRLEKRSENVSVAAASSSVLFATVLHSTQRGQKR